MINDTDMGNLRHMLGIGSHIKNRQWGYRNHFAPGGADIQSMERLESAGLVRKGRTYEETHYYHATEAGCVAAGLKPYQIRKAMESINRLKSPLKLLSAEEVTEPGWYCWRGREGEKKWVFIEFKHSLFTFENGLRFEPCPPFGQFIGPLPMEVMNVE